VVVNPGSTKEKVAWLAAQAFKEERLKLNTRGKLTNTVT